MAITINRPTTIVELCTDLVLQADHERAVKELEIAQKQRAGMENSGIPELAHVVEEIESRMQDAMLEFTLQALSRKDFAEFETANPARAGEKTDEVFGLNVAAADQLIAPCITKVTRKTTGKVEEFDPVSEWNDLADQMSNGQWEKFFIAALQINRGATKVPFSVAASLAIRRSEKNLKQQNG